MVAAGVADEMLVQLAYAIGVAEPVSVFVDTYGKSHVQLSDGEIAEKIKSLFSLRPHDIEQRLKLRHPSMRRQRAMVTWDAPTVW